MSHFLASVGASLLAFSFGLAAASEEAALAFLETHCYECHDDLTAESDLNLLSLDLDFSTPEGMQTWTTVFGRVDAGEMPPPETERPDPAERDAFLAHLSGGMAAIERERIEAEGRAMVRRLNRLEYQHTLADLLALPHLEIADALPPEGSAHGFDKSAEALDFSHVHASRLMEVADAVLRSAIAPQSAKPQSRKIRVEMTGPENVKQNINGFFAMLKQTEAIPLHGMEIDSTITSVRGDFQKRDPGTLTDEPPRFDGIAVFNNGAFNLGLNIKPFEVPVSGRYTIRVHGFGIRNDRGVLAPTERIETVGFYSDDRTLGFVDLPAYEPTTGELTAWLDRNEKIKPLVASSPNAKIQTALKVKPGEVVPPEHFGYKKFESPGVAFRWFELEGPHLDAWPPESHRRLFGNLKLAPGDPVEIVSTDPPKDARRLMRQFLVQALRRPVTGEDMMVPMQVVMQKLRRKETFVEAMIAGYRTVLVSPEFLLMSATEPGELSDHALAERLSYFLWNSTPDDRLRNLARDGKLADPAMLRSETDRLLADPKSDRFVAHFLDKWLKLEDIALTEPDGNLYPEYNPLLTDSSLWESRAYFRELIEKDLGAEYIAHSDFLMVNQRLAELYEIPGVSGNEIRRVALPEGSVRGGLLTQASVLKTTANGTITSPIVRGDYVMTHLLGDPPPPPPPSVPAVEPDISGGTTIREQLALHSEDKSCATCHAKIDPPGFALESFDVMGGFRQRYRSIDKGDPIPNLYHEGKPAITRLALAVDSSGELPDGTAFRGIRDFKGILLEREEQLARNLLEQFIVYATGAPASFADEENVAAMMTELAGSDYGVRSMIHAIVQSPLFLEK